MLPCAHCFNDNINNKIDADLTIVKEENMPVPSDNDYLPVPGNGGLIIITSLHYNSAGIFWTKGSDDITPAGQLLYKVVISRSNNITTEEEMDLNGTIVLDWSADIDSFEVLGLSGSSIYYANVMVRDMNGNTHAYVPVSFTTPAAPPYTGNLPVPGNYGIIAILSIANNSAKLIWTMGSDDSTPADQLQYKAVISTFNNITTSEEMEQNGIKVLDWSAGIGSFEILGLTGNSTYYANVMVRDMEGNRKAYIPVSFTTPAPPPYTGNLPVPGNNGLVAIVSITNNSAMLSWTKGSDDSTPAVQLMYKAVISNTNNITTAEEMDQKGIPVMGWTADIGGFEIPGLLINTVYYANIMVMDMEGNKKAYNPVTFITPGIIYMLSAGSYAGNMILPSVASPRAEIDKMVQAYHAKYILTNPALTCSNVRAFIGISGTDSIKNFPANFGLPVNWPIKGPGGAIIGYNWADLFDGSINATLVNAGIVSKIAVISSSWWSGANADGSFAVDNCSSALGVPWSALSNTLKGQTGLLNSLDQTWLTNTPDMCFNYYDLYYLCW